VISGFRAGRIARAFAALYPASDDSEAIRAGHVLGLLSLAEHLEGVRHVGECPGCKIMRKDAGEEPAK
jgi:hypothetical protein